MKKKWMGLLLVFLVLTAAGCGKKEQAQEDGNAVQETAGTETQEAVETTDGSGETGTEEMAGEVMVEYQDDSWEEKADDGTVLLKVGSNVPKVTVPGQKEAEERINAFLEEQETAYRATAKAYTEMAQQDYALRVEEGDEENWFTYELGREYTDRRVDEKIISFTQEGYEFTGGAHPNSVRSSLNFDAITGKRLLLADVVEDIDTAVEFVNQFILQELDREEYKDYLFDDYKTSLADIFTDDSWYLNDKGFVIICNEYIVTPHVVGIMEFTIPYDEFEPLKDEYRP